MRPRGTSQRCTAKVASVAVACVAVLASLTFSLSAAASTKPTVHSHAALDVAVTQPFGLSVQGAPTHIRLKGTARRVIRFTPVVLTATVTSAINLTGTVRFTDNGSPVPGCTAVPSRRTARTPCTARCPTASSGPT